MTKRTPELSYLYWSHTPLYLATRCPPSHCLGVNSEKSCNLRRSKKAFFVSVQCITPWKQSRPGPGVSRDVYVR